MRTKRREKLDLEDGKNGKPPLHTHTQTRTHTSPNSLSLPLFPMAKTGLCQRRVHAAASSKVLSDNYWLWLPWQYVSFFQDMLLTTMFNNVNKAKNNKQTKTNKN